MSGEKYEKKLKDDYLSLIITLLYCVRAAALKTKLYWGGRELEHNLRRNLSNFF